MNRRAFLQTASALAAVASAPSALRAAAPVRKFTVALTPGSIGVVVKSQSELNGLAHRHRFESVEPRADELAAMSADQVAATVADLKAKNLVWAAAGLTVDFRKDDALFREGLAKLPGLAAGLRRAGVARVGTWLMPSHAELTYTANFKQHAARLREIAQVLRDHGLRLGLEYVGTPTLLVRNRYPFLHTMAEARDLIAAIGTGNVGLVLDTWHWWTASDTVADILALTNADVVSVDLNDAPVGLAKSEQQDNTRELPLATGVIDTAAFVNALAKIGYDGPVRPEPFNRTLSALENDPACAAASTALHKAMALVKG
jgi:sugar phosphate isomerase/epimerase